MNAKQEQQIIGYAIAQGLDSRGVLKRLATARNKPAKNSVGRRFEHIERNYSFDAAIQTCRERLAKKNGVAVGSISKSAAIRYAVIEMSKCERCNGIGIIGIRNGDDDIPCPDCTE